MAITVNSRKAAWELANKLFPTDYLKDEDASSNAGYPVYWSTDRDRNAWISDLNCRLEINIGAETTNIWIEEPEALETEEEKMKFAEELNTWLGYYTDEVIERVMSKMDQIIADKRSRFMIRELHKRTHKEEESMVDSFRWALGGDSPRVWRHTATTHASSYRDVLYDLWINE